MSKVFCCYLLYHSDYASQCARDRGNRPKTLHTAPYENPANSGPYSRMSESISLRFGILHAISQLELALLVIPLCCHIHCIRAT